MATTADKQRTIVIVLTILFVLLIVTVSLWGPGDDSMQDAAAVSTPTTIEFGPLGNGVATCDRRAPTAPGMINYVVVYSLEETSAKSFTFQVELTGPNGNQQIGLARAVDAVSVRQAELPLDVDEPAQTFVDCRITGVQQDKRVLIANN